MDQDDIEHIYRLSKDKIEETDMSLKRYSYDSIDWKDRLVGLRGARGVGKTTLLLQKIVDSGEERSRSLYVSLDSVWLDAKEIYRLAEHFVQHGGARLVLDEVHYVKDWQRIIKNLSDDFKGLKIAYTGSSMLKLKSRQGDLSRRQIGYELPGLSFREFLAFEGVGTFKPLTLSEILSGHEEIARDVRRKIHVLPLFEKYFRGGYYPFYRESYGKFRERLAETVNKVLEVDYPAIDEVAQETIRKTRRRLMVLAESCPQTPNMSRLYSELNTSRDQGLKMLKALERAGLLALVDATSRKLDDLSKPEKIYVDNANLMRALVPRVDVGVERETFLNNQLRKDHAVTYTGVGDFVIDGKWTFEVGGRKKGFSQIAGVPDSYVVNDDVSVGRGNKIPLWLFGFLY